MSTMELKTYGEITAMRTSAGVPPLNARSFSPSDTSIGPDAFRNKYQRDTADMARFGKRQQLRRSFGLLSMVGLTCTLMITWEGFLTTFAVGLVNGGRAGVLYGYLFVWAGNILQVLVMAEMASMVPLSGGQYNWVSVLAPRWCYKFLSYLTGWTTVIAWQAVVASAAFLGGGMIEALVVLNCPDTYVSQPWHGTVLLLAVLLLSVGVNTLLSKILPHLEAMVLFVHILGFFVVLVPLLNLAPNRASAKEVFASFSNGGDWPTEGLAFFIGTTGAMFAFIGIDAATHLAEEIENAGVVIPRSMTISVLLNGALGFGMAVAIVFCMGDVQTALGSSSAFPYVEVFQQALGSIGGTTALASLVVVAMVFATIGCFLSASRMTWAFAREKGLPGSGYISRVSESTGLPLWSILLTTTISALSALINLGSSATFLALTSLVVAAFYSTFLLAAGVMLHKRLTVPNDRIEWGPFRLGKAGVPITILSIVYSLIGIFFSFWPTNSTVTAASMNWSSVVFFGALFFSMGFWVLHGRKVYRGPVGEILDM